MTFMKKKANITILIRCMYILYALDTVNRVSENVVLKESQAKKRVIFTKEILYVNLISWHKCRVLYFRIVFFDGMQLVRMLVSMWSEEIRQNGAVD